jgi:hypothetical protein
MWVVKGGDLPLVTANPGAYGLDTDISLDDFTGKQIDETSCVKK